VTVSAGKGEAVAEEVANGMADGITIAVGNSTAVAVAEGTTLSVGKGVGSLTASEGTTVGSLTTSEGTTVGSLTTSEGTTVGSLTTSEGTTVGSLTTSEGTTVGSLTTSEGSTVLVAEGTTVCEGEEVAVATADKAVFVGKTGNGVSVMTKPTSCTVASTSIVACELGVDVTEDGVGKSVAPVGTQALNKSKKLTNLMSRIIIYLQQGLLVKKTGSKTG